jgi:glycosyltransferase involved in cell wall biosynthesis
VRILYHHRTQALDGQRVHIRELQKALRAAGHEVHEVAPVTADEPAGAVPRPTWRRRCFGLLARLAPRGVYDLLELAYNLVGYRKLARAIHEFQPDFIYERYASNTVAGVWVSQRFGVPLLLEVNSPLAEEKRRLKTLWFYRLCRRLESYVLNRATCVLAVTGALQQILANQEGMSPERIHVVQNGVRPEAFRVPTAVSRARRYQLGFEDRVVIGAIGFFREWHGIDLLLECVARNPILRKRASVLLVGKAQALKGLKKLARKLGIEQQVVFTGSVPHDEVPAYLGAIDVALIPRAVEYASPLKLFEYMAAGKAIVAPRQDNLLEVLTEDVDALCFHPEDAIDMEEALVKTVSDSGLRSRLGEQARRTIDRQRLTWDGNAARLLQVFQEIRGARKVPVLPQLVESRA